jgi:hypothetical protein
VGLFDKLFGLGTDIEARDPEFAGDIYPEVAEQLRLTVSRLLNGAGTEPNPDTRALLAPHAAYEYAGGVMAEAYASIATAEVELERVVVVGSSRLVPFRGLALDAWEGFETPLGILEYPSDGFWDDAPEPVRRMAAAFDPEESIEAQLPFVQAVLGDVELVPVLVGDAGVEDVLEALRWLVDGDSLLIVSTNLSYDETLERAEELDRETVSAILDAQGSAISRAHSPGRVALRGLLALAEERGWTAECLARSNSHEQGGQADSVVGYGAFRFS